MTKQELKALIKEVIIESKLNQFKIEHEFKEGDIVQFLTNPRDQEDDGEVHPNPSWAIGKIVDVYDYDCDIMQLKPVKKMHNAVMKSSIKKMK